MNNYVAALQAQTISLRGRLTALADYDGLCYEERREHNLISGQIDALEIEIKRVEAEVDTTEKEVDRLKGIVSEVQGCFHAAECEGLTAALLNTTDANLKDLVERRLMYALYAANEL